MAEDKSKAKSNNTPEKTGAKKKNVKIGEVQHRKVKIEAAKKGKKVEDVLNELIDASL